MHQFDRHICRDATLTINIFNCVLVKIVTKLYYETRHYDKSNDILYTNIYLFFIGEKISQPWYVNSAIVKVMHIKKTEGVFLKTHVK